MVYCDKVHLCHKQRRIAWLSSGVKWEQSAVTSTGSPQRGRKYVKLVFLKMSCRLFKCSKERLVDVESPQHMHPGLLLVTGTQPQAAGCWLHCLALTPSPAPFVFPERRHYTPHKVLLWDLSPSLLDLK